MSTPASHDRLKAILPLTLLFLGGPAMAQLPAPDLFPARGARDICPDTPLKMIFTAPPALGTGKIEIHDAATDAVVAAIELNQPTRTQSIGGLANYVAHPFLLNGNELILSLPAGSLAYNKTYYVAVPAGAFGKDAWPATEMDGKRWQFTTKGAPPDADAKILTVAAAGMGDFATIQGAIDFIPPANKIPRTILIKSGTYNEIICLLNRSNITLQGENREKSVIQYANNDRFNPNSNGNPFGPGAPQPGAADPEKHAVYRRGLLLAHNCKDLTITNLTIRNTTSKGGSQAETIIVNGSPTDGRFILSNVNLYSFQDTLQVNGQAYIANSYIEGDVDFIWGTGPAFFQNVHARAVTNGAIFTTARCPPPPSTNHGFVFKECTLDGKPGVTGTFLARIEANRFPTSETILLNCIVSNAIAPAGWRPPTGGDASNIHFWEFNSRTPDGKPIDASQRIAGSKQLNADADKQAIANYSDPAWVLGNWTPKPPDVTTRPVTPPSK
jgi:pectin methylesterase-like acyl-CoA thioesterase